MKIILLNGAPFSGKDTLAQQLLKVIPDSELCLFKEPLYEEFGKRHNLTRDEVIELCTGPSKDEPQEKIGGLIPRAELIDISENGIKKEFGEDGVAMKVVVDILSRDAYAGKTFIFPDSGFPNELAYLKKRLERYGLTKTTLVRIIREGCDFAAKKDSRSFLPNPAMIIDNNVDESNLPEAERGQHMLNQFIKLIPTV